MAIFHMWNRGRVYQFVLPSSTKHGWLLKNDRAKADVEISGKIVEIKRGIE